MNTKYKRIFYSILILSIAFFLIAFKIIDLKVSKATQNYLLSEPKASNITLIFDADFNCYEHHGSIGNEIKHYIFINGEEIDLKIPIQFGRNERLSVYAKTVEFDSLSDVGQSEENVIDLSKIPIQDIANGYKWNFSKYRVTETRGRTAGSYRAYNVSMTLQRVLSSNEQRLFSQKARNAKIYCISAVALVILAAFIILKKRSKRQELIEFNENKKKYTKMYGGMDLLVLAGAPPGAYVENDMPHQLVKGTDIYSVKISKNGHVFHRVNAKCSRNLFIENYINVTDRKPCSKCLPFQPNPEWFAKYLRFKEIKEKYNIK